MFSTNKKIQFIDYQDSYYYHQKRKKQRRKGIKFVLLITLFLLLIAVIVPLAQSKSDLTELGADQTTNTQNPLVQSPQLIFSHPDKHNHMALPLDIDANIEINGLIAYTKIKQVFINPFNIELEGIYQFPLPENAAIKHLSVKIGDKEIIGQIMEKKVARIVYNKAKQQGKKTSLMEQQRANLFTNKIANIPAQSTVVVTLTFIMPVTFFNNELAINLPLAMTTRYQPEQYQQSPAEQSFIPLRSPNRQSQLNELGLTVFNEDKLNYPFLNLSTVNSTVLAKSQATINIKLDAGVSIASVHSTSHAINTKALDNQESQYLITLSKAQTLANRNFNLTWQLEPNQQPQVSSFTEKVDDEYFTLLTFLPPHTDKSAVFARDIIFIIDTSGSMQGSSMAQAKASLQQSIALLNNYDSFNVIAFDDSVDLLFAKTQMVTDHTIRQAQYFIDNLHANGGTEMYRPLSQALVMAKNSEQSPEAIRQVVFITDGAVANEFELMQLLDSAQDDFRLFTVGIGAAPNGYFMKKAAQFGRGSYLYIQNINEVQSSMSTLMTKISQPAVSNIQLMVDNQIQQKIDVYPKRITDLYLGEPMQVAIKTKHPLTSVQLTGDTSSEPWYQQLIIDDTLQSKGISTIWARNKIEDLLDGLVIGADKVYVKEQVIATSIAHQIISPYTSFIAVEKQPEDFTSTPKHNNKLDKRQPNSSTNPNQNFLVAMPKTALGWQQQFYIGVLLIAFALLTSRCWGK